MAKRFIGIDLDGFDVRVAILTVTSGNIDVVLDKRSFETSEEAVMAINEMVISDATLGDRVVTALPTRVGLFRRLHFPFREKNKIEAALTLDLSAKLPVTLEEHVIDFLPPRPRQDDYEVDAVVIHRGEIESLLEHFPDPHHNPRRIDFFPFALLPALIGQEGILIYCRQYEVVVALVYEGMIWDYRLLPGIGELSEDEVFNSVSFQICQLESAVNKEDLPLWVIGAGASERLLSDLRASGRSCRPPAVDVFGDGLSCEMAPAALLAVAEMHSGGKGEQLNFRKGELAAQGQIEVFRNKVIFAAIMFLLVLVGGAVTMHLGYLQKSRQVNNLKQQLTNVFRQTMPKNATLQDAPLQMQGHLKELRKQVQLFGLGGQGGATVLQNLSSSIDKELKIDLREYSYSGDEVRLDGYTDSFVSVNRIAELLKKNPLFASVEISNAKLSTDNTQVDFELQLTIAGAGGGQ